MKLMQTHMSLLQQMGPERAMAEMEIIKEIAPTLSPAARQAASVHRQDDRDGRLITNACRSARRA